MIQILVSRPEVEVVGAGTVGAGTVGAGVVAVEELTLEIAVALPDLTHTTDTTNTPD